MPLLPLRGSDARVQQGAPCAVKRIQVGRKRIGIELVVAEGIALQMAAHHAGVTGFQYQVAGEFALDVEHVVQFLRQAAGFFSLVPRKDPGRWQLSDR